ncbi:LPS assembly lipoprotein LptE [Danxiaibacter flavus]|uniref:LPS assembly lipoprotein LptE n=1 Tax=Danxiaibacter flavus TaxID=3049108 RepID=A0ABV3ZD96_9BACT|nr:LPS assembly lipoprotein LptE [Chitinophagaceae bacterium DXS]
MKQKFGVPAMNRTILQILFVSLITLLSACGVYTFRDVSIDYSKIKTFKVEFIENKAPYKNPLLSPSLTDALRQKITSYTKLTPTQNDDAHYQIKGYISNYSVSTSAISGQQAAANRLTVAAHMTLINTVENKTQEFDVSRDFDFSAGISLTQAEGSLMPDIVKNMSDEIFNRLFSNW